MNSSSWPSVLPRPGNQRLTGIKSISRWFEIYKVNDLTFALLEPFHVEEVISYLIVGDKRAILFDTGMGISNIQVEVEELVEVPVIVVNSHSHYDHIGENFRFSEVWAFDNDWEVKRIQRGYSIDQCKEFMHPNWYLELPSSFDFSTYQIQPSTVTRRLTNNEAIDIGNRTLIVHHTPGHSPGSICLQDTQFNLLFTGDTFYPGTLYAHLQGSNLHDYINSLRSLTGLLDEIDHLCPAHNEACVPKTFLSSALEAFKQVDNDIKKASAKLNEKIYYFKGFNVKV
ncbi:MAG: MBL fold metallo-hydrolase [Candidatus Hodarchaeota archaeon]